MPCTVIVHCFKNPVTGGFPLAAYALRRFFRIAPLFYVALAASLLRDHWQFSLSHGAAAITASAAFVFNFWPGWETGIVWASWTIGVEMPFYCLFPFLEARSRTLVTAAALVLALLLGVALWPQAALLHRAGFPQPVIDLQVQFGLLRHLPVFAFGILAWRAYDRFIARRTPPLSVGVALLLGAACLYACLLRGALGPGPFTDAYYWQAVIYCAVVLGAAIHPSRIIVNRLTLFMGKVSYSLYLLHPFVVLPMIPIYRAIEAKGWPSTIGFGLCAALTLGTTVALAAVIYALIEAPGMRLGKRLTARLGESSATSERGAADSIRVHAWRMQRGVGCTTGFLSPRAWMFHLSSRLTSNTPLKSWKRATARRRLPGYDPHKKPFHADKK